MKSEACKLVTLSLTSKYFESPASASLVHAFVDGDDSTRIATSFCGTFESGAPPGQIVVDAGDMLSRFTNEVVPATTHRVVNPPSAVNRERYSMPFFVHPYSACPLDIPERFADLLAGTDAAISHEDWDAANAAFHEFQIDLARNALLSGFYRELSVNLMMQVIRGGHVEGHAHLVTEHRRIVDAFSAGELSSAQEAIREHIETGRRIALDAIERAGGVL